MLISQYLEVRMKSHAQVPDRITASLRLTPSMKLALAHLLEAHDAARIAKQPKWEFAVELHALKEISHSEVRCLICQGLVEHAVESTRNGSKRRVFSKPAGLHFIAASCLVLSDKGVKAGRALAEKTMQTQTNSPPRDAIPAWDGRCRQLWLGEVLVKEFRQLARNQEAILAAFQEEGWPPCIDDPLPGVAGQDASERLHNAIKRLNIQLVRLLRFSTDGTGQGALWQRT